MNRDDLLRRMRAKVPHPATARELYSVLGISREERVPFKRLLRHLVNDGDLILVKSKLYGLPDRMDLVVGKLDGHSSGIGFVTPERPVEGLTRDIFVAAHDLQEALHGDRVVVRIERHREDGRAEGKIVQVLERAASSIVGRFDVDSTGLTFVVPFDKRLTTEVQIPRDETMGAEAGQMVTVTVTRWPTPTRGPAGRITEILGDINDPGVDTEIILRKHGIPDAHGADAVAEATRIGGTVREKDLAGRTDFRDRTVVTIDGETARDFDDAVWAEEDPAPDNKGGFHLIVAIADVAHYVQPGDAIDREAFKRGNSVYMPDRVVPMLPEKLSNDLCSLRPDGDRAAMAVHMWIDKAGNLMRHRFVRALIRSAARCTYEQVQRLKDGYPTIDDPTWPEAVDHMILGPLYAAYAALDDARRRRGTLDLEIPERKVILNEKREIEKIVPRERLDSHKLIEEFMIAANVAAAETLEKAGWPCMYRVHDLPDEAKVEALREFLASFDISLPRGQGLRSRNFADILAKVAGTPESRLISETMLRSQSQAIYSPENLGHFGLALQRYAHFTSPIRRYSDLLVHRALIGALKLGDGALEREMGKSFVAWGEHISQTERRAMLAERDAMDRYMAIYMKDRVGASFPARIAGVTRFGLFVALDETGAQGLVPIRSLGQDYFDHDEARHNLTGRSTGEVFSLGDAVTATLIDADPITGSLLFRIDDHQGTTRPGYAGPRKSFGRASGPGGPGPQDRRPPNKKFGKRSGPSKKSAGSRGKRGKDGGASPNGNAPKKFR